MHAAPIIPPRPTFSGLFSAPEVYSDSRGHGPQGPPRNVRIPRAASSGGGAIARSEDGSRCVVAGIDCKRCNTPRFSAVSESPTGPLQPYASYKFYNPRIYRASWHTGRPWVAADTGSSPSAISGTAADSRSTAPTQTSLGVAEVRVSVCSMLPLSHSLARL